MKQYLKEVARGKKGSRDLTFMEAKEVAQSIFSGEATEAQIAAFLVAERLKSESVEELLAFVLEIRSRSARISLPPELQQRVVDLAGPYNGRNSFVATIPVALLLAESGIPVLLHGSKSLPPKYSTPLKDILEKLGICVQAKAEQISISLQQANIGFSHTELLSPPLALLRKVREEIVVRTFLNTIEKMVNLADAKRIMLGAFHKTALELNAAVLRELHFEKAFIVQGAEGSEDIPIHRKSFIYEVRQKDMSTFDVDPEQYGLKHRKNVEKEKLSLSQQVELIKLILEGEETEELAYYRDAVLLNAGVRYFLLEQTASIEAGIEIAKQQLKEKSGLAQLKLWIEKQVDRVERRVGG